MTLLQLSHLSISIILSIELTAALCQRYTLVVAQHESVVTHAAFCAERVVFTVH